MYKGYSVVALITARGGSKGLPRKNIRLLLSKPLIAWTIEEAKKCRLIDRVIVSTEDEKISNTARKYGGEVPFIRPKGLAQDRTEMVDVIIHALDWLKTSGYQHDLFVLLQPTSPLRTAEDIEGAIKLFFSKKANAVVSVCEAERHPYLANTLPKDDCMKNFLRADIMDKNRQELPKYYRLNGAIYLADCGYFRRYKSFYGKNSYAYIMPQDRSADIDSEIDLRWAEYLLKKRK